MQCCHQHVAAINLQGSKWVGNIISIDKETDWSMAASNRYDISPGAGGNHVAIQGPEVFSLFS